MLRFLGVVFVALVLSLAATLLDLKCGNGFIKQFAQGQSLQIMATALALNVATITFLIGSLLNIEKDLQQTAFAKTRSEVKQNIIAMAILFIFNFMIVTAIKVGEAPQIHVKLDRSEILASISLWLLFIFGAFVVEVSLSVLKIKNVFSNHP